MKTRKIVITAIPIALSLMARDSSGFYTSVIKEPERTEGVGGICKNGCHV